MKVFVQIEKIIFFSILFFLPTGLVSAQRLHEAEKSKAARTVINNYKTTIEFRNESNKTIKVYWLDEQGRRKFSVTLAPKQSHVFETYLSEPWLITDERDNALSLYYPDAQPRVIYLRERDFGETERIDEDDDDFAVRPEKDYKPLQICANQEIPRGYLIIAANSEWNCPNWTATGKNSYTIKRPKPTEPTKVCREQKIPRGFVITGASAEWNCPNWTATGNNAYTIIRPKDEQTICSISEVPRGFVITSTYSDWGCPNWTATGSNAKKIKRVR